MSEEELSTHLRQLPEGLRYLLWRLKASLIALENMAQGPALGVEVHQAHTQAMALSPLISRFTDHLSFDLEFEDEQLTEEAWDWLCGQRLRGLTLQQQGLARLAPAAQLPSSPFRHLASLTVSVGDGSQLGGALPHLPALGHLEVRVSGAGASFPRPPRRLASLTLRCSHTASMRSLLPLCMADEVTITAEDEIHWITDIGLGLLGLPYAQKLLQAANGQYRGGSTSSTSGTSGGGGGDNEPEPELRLLIPTGFHQMFSSMELSRAISTAAVLNCYAAAVAAQLSPVAPTRVTLRARGAIRLLDPAGPLPNSRVNFAPEMPKSAVVWESLCEAAAELAGMQGGLSCSFSIQPAVAGGEGAAAEPGGVTAVLVKTCPAKHWPLPKGQPARSSAAAAEAAGASGGSSDARGQLVQANQRVSKRQPVGRAAVWVGQAVVACAVGALAGAVLHQLGLGSLARARRRG